MRGVIGILVPGAFGVEEPVEFLLVKGGALLGSVGDGDGVVRAALTIAGLGRFGAVAVLAVSRRAIST